MGTQLSRLSRGQGSDHRGCTAGRLQSPDPGAAGRDRYPVREDQPSLERRGGPGHHRRPGPERREPGGHRTVVRGEPGPRRHRRGERCPSGPALVSTRRAARRPGSGAGPGPPGPGWGGPLMTTNGPTPTMGRAQREATALRYLRDRPGQIIAIQDAADKLGMPASTLHTMIKRWMANPALEISKPRRGLVLIGRADDTAPAPAGPAA